MTTPPLTFPRQSARTRGFSLGAPRSFRVADDGSRVVFLRSGSGSDPVNALWVFDVDAGRERLVADPRAILNGDDEDLPAAERARRERTRERASGFVTYDCDPGCTTAVATLGGRLVLVDLVGDGGVTALETAPGAFDPRLSPTADHVAYVVGRDLRVLQVDGDDRPVVESGDPDVSWGSAEFVAAEEMERTRGHWWSPDGRHLAVARVDVSPVELWHLADLAEPGTPPTSIRYPAAGTANAIVGLWVFGLDGTATPIEWDADGFPYLVRVRLADERRRPAPRRRAEPGPAHDGRAAGGPGHRGDHPAPTPARRGLGRHRPRDAGLGRRTTRHRRELRRGADG